MDWRLAFTICFCVAIICTMITILCVTRIKALYSHENKKIEAETTKEICDKIYK